jgi:pSer/pThr/pTyr-binding forkhead associated (FHA) protein
VTLLGRGGPLQGQSYPLDPGDYGVGRDPAVCAVILPAGTKGVSRHHATLRVRPDGSVLLQDNNSSAGTFVAGRRLPVADWQPLAAGEVFTLGEDDVRFELRRSGGERRGA